MYIASQLPGEGPLIWMLIKNMIMMMMMMMMMMIDGGGGGGGGGDDDDDDDDDEDEDDDEDNDDDYNSISLLFSASVEPPWERSVAGNKVPYYVE